jgi:hypothetical protein
MVRGFCLSAGLVLAFLIAMGMPAAWAMDLTLQAYADFRLVAPPKETSWVHGGLSKFRYGGGTSFRFAEAVAQGNLTLDDHLDGVAVLRLEPSDRDVVDPLETYLYWHPEGDGALSYSVKAGAFFPTISLENDDLGWASPYTLTPSAINSWIGEELRTIGSEGIAKYRTENAGTISLTAAVLCCNDPTGILIADRGWAMDDRPTGIWERLRLPDATLRQFRRPVPGTTAEFIEIDKRWGWYAGLGWQMDGIGKLTVLRYDNQANPADASARDTAWETKFWAFGARTQIEGVMLIAQQLSGYTAVAPRGTDIVTKFQSGFLLASYDWDVWRLSLREDLFQTRHLTATPPNPMSEDGNAFTASLSWSGYDWLRLTGEVVAMDSRRLQYISAGLSPSANLPQSQFQLSARFFY